MIKLQESQKFLKKIIQERMNKKYLEENMYHQNEDKKLLMI